VSITDQEEYIGREQIQKIPEKNQVFNTQKSPQRKVKKRKANPLKFDDFCYV
jgi:hypothetical protein